MAQAHFENEFTPHAAMVLSNTGGIQIELSSCGTMLRYRYNFDGIADENFETVEICPEELTQETFEEHEDVPMGFYIGDTFYSLSEFMRYGNY